MRSRVRNSFEFLSMSALDLFASALGVFVLISFVLLPFYLNQPTLDAAVTGARAEISTLSSTLALYREKLTATQASRQDAEASLAAAQRRLTAATAAVVQPKVAPDPVDIPPRRKPGTLAIPPLDLVIVIDTTGSMRDELRDLQFGLLGIIRILHRLSASLAVGVVAYRDRGEVYLTRTLPLARIDEGTLSKALAFVDGLRAEGGGDDPEAVEAGLAEAMKMAWRERTMGRLLLIGDQPPHAADLNAALDLAARFRSLDGFGRTVGAIYAGPEQKPERLFFERLAVAGGGDFRVHRGEMIESVLLSVLGDGGKP
jgi:hypothetical protein